MSVKVRRFDLDWWVVQKRLIYIIVGLLILAVMAAGASVYVWLYGNPLRNIGTSNVSAAGARFISLEGDVRIVRAATRETVAAASDTRLFPGDTVQTQADGRALVRMADGSNLLVRPNSTVIVRDNTISDEGKKTNVRVAVGTGQINVRTEQQPEGTNNVVETSQSQNKLGSQTGASFGVNPDSSTEIRVNTGQVETATNDGQKTVVHADEYVSVNPSGTVTTRQKLLDIPSPVAPRDLEKISIGDKGTASVNLRWQRPASGTPSYYRVEVATSPFFVGEGRVIERDQLASTEFGASDLRPGVYFWRVRGTAASGQTSDWSEPLKFVVLKESHEEVAVSDWSVDHIGGNIYLVHGRTQAGNAVRISGREALAAADGTFQLQVTAPTGTRDVVAEARDSQGNRNEYRVSLTTGTAQPMK
jgi:hypothetical protein